MDIKLFGLGPTRSARVLWTLREIGAEFEYVEDRSLIGSDELKSVHPLGKLPGVLIDGRPIFESVAICTYLADTHPEAKLIAPTGTWERAMHEQWSAFTLAELEAWLWVSARHTFVYPEDQRIPEVIPLNTVEADKALAAFEDALSDADYLIGNQFSVTDIIAAYAINWARKNELLTSYPNLTAYIERLQQRPANTLS